jgi:integrase
MVRRPRSSIGASTPEPAGIAMRTLQPLRRLYSCSSRFRLELLPGGTCIRWKAMPFHGAHPKPLFELLRGLVRDNLGHASLTTTSQYLHVDDDRRHRETDEKHRIDW